GQYVELAKLKIDQLKEGDISIKEKKVSRNTILPSIAVLPFTNLSNDPEQTYFSDGISEDLITDLSKLSGLFVIARNTSFQYRGRETDIHSIGKELGVKNIITGSVRKYSNSLRISAQLIDVNTKRNIWAERYDRELKDVFSIQDDVTNNIIKALSLHLTSQEKSGVTKNKANNVEAYDLFLQGQMLMSRRTKDDNAQAQELMKQAIKKDPNYSRPYGSLAIAKVHAANSKWADAPVQEMDRALELAEISVKISPMSPHALWSLGFTHLFRKEFEKAEIMAKKSIQYSPNYADGYGLLSLINNHLWKAEQAIKYINKAIELNPHFTFDYLYNLGMGYYTLEKYDQAIQYLKKALERNPNFSRGRMFLVASYVGKGLIDDAEWELEQVISDRPSASITNIIKDTAFADRPSKRRFISQLKQAGLSE
ncbi:MAG: tetratricopeptide repeat protein, partial [Gammaproteobacteria bacterium]|nr:tetratricopeptide repeat protein [Gammaproteobacteria bacterium]